MKENVWLTYDEKSREELHTLSEEYKTFLSRCKTERECTAFFQAEAEKAGYRNLSSLIAEGAAVKGRRQGVRRRHGKDHRLMFQVGRQPLTDGMNILCAHIDSPRLDLKQVPLIRGYGTGLSWIPTITAASRSISG